MPPVDVITLTLLHPLQSTPIQSWTFDQETQVSVGRSTDNHVVLYSAVVSRHHVELCYENSVWEVVSLGANGTYMDNQRVTRSPLKDGSVFRLARSGPNLQVSISATSSTPLSRNISPLLPPSARSSSPPSANASLSSQPLGVSQPQSASSDAFALASERISKILEEDEMAVISGELLFDTQTGQPLKTINSVGAYQILKPLGYGPMSMTHLVWHNSQTFVMKQLHEKWGRNPQVAAAFQTQFRSLQPLQHPGIPQVIDVMELDGQQTVVMEMIYGQSLAELVASQGRISQAQAIALTLEVCDVLEELHNAPSPIVHGDLHPRHLLRRQVLRSGQEIVLIDFGLSRWHGWKAGLPCASQGYVAPELGSQPPTAAGDVYALGATLAFLLTGQNPKNFYGTPENGGKFRPEAMQGLEATAVVRLIQDMTNPNPASRPPASAIAQMLRQII
ncbi:MAG: FHA domain-containing serine/threonine-protein kinase [Alkalinema sp. CAN_BIN05]|nr:FHA domain-containing serine/threonine-protein kinase [Alkalinema sp. CAN_BIN05]